jgi:hypothetical protein
MADTDLARIEQLLTELADQPGEKTALMREHLESARFYLTGTMPEEYDFALGLAQQVLPDVENKDVQAKLEDFLQEKKKGQPQRNAAGPI